MKEDNSIKKSNKDLDKNEEGYPLYPPNEDIYNQNDEMTELDPENLNKTKAPNEDSNSNNEKSFIEDVSGGDLDVPGSELDDDQEEIGNEDEENNYYSMGQD